jgi:hypothetical protein
MERRFWRDDRPTVRQPAPQVDDAEKVKEGPPRRTRRSTRGSASASCPVVAAVDPTGRRHAPSSHPRQGDTPMRTHGANTASASRSSVSIAAGGDPTRRWSTIPSARRASCARKPIPQSARNARSLHPRWRSSSSDPRRRGRVPREARAASVVAAFSLPCWVDGHGSAVETVWAAAPLSAATARPPAFSPMAFSPMAFSTVVFSPVVSLAVTFSPMAFSPVGFSPVVSLAVAFSPAVSLPVASRQSSPQQSSSRRRSFRRRGAWPPFDARALGRTVARPRADCERDNGPRDSRRHRCPPAPVGRGDRVPATYAIRSGGRSDRQRCTFHRPARTPRVERRATRSQAVCSGETHRAGESPSRVAAFRPSRAASRERVRRARTSHRSDSYGA